MTQLNLIERERRICPACEEREAQSCNGYCWICEAEIGEDLANRAYIAALTEHAGYQAARAA